MTGRGCTQTAETKTKLSVPASEPDEHDLPFQRSRPPTEAPHGGSGSEHNDTKLRRNKLKELQENFKSEEICLLYYTVNCPAYSSLCCTYPKVGAVLNDSYSSKLR